MVSWHYEELSFTQDSLNYKYNAGTNQLQYIKDSVPSTNYPNDIDAQNANNYIYDKSGNMIADNSQAMSVSWSPYGKILSTSKAGGANLQFSYNAMQQRVVKRVAQSGDTTRTYYIRAAQGNTMGVYTRHNDSVSWREQYIFGSSRLGLYRADTLVNKGLQVISKIYEGKKNYELTNHLGNVLAVINDRKTDSLNGSVKVGFNAVVISATDYFPFGMTIDSRSYAAAATYRYGFNGKENDKETGEQDYGMRIYSLWGNRFLSIDPLINKYPDLSPYQFAGNNPIKYIDLDGSEPTGAGTDPHSLIITEPNARNIGNSTTPIWVFNAKYMDSKGNQQRKLDIPYYKGGTGTFSSAQLWRMQKLSEIDEDARQQTNPYGKRELYVVPNQNKFGAYDCLVLARENAKIVLGVGTIPELRKGLDGTMTNFLKDMHSSGYAGDLSQVNFSDQKGNLIRNGEKEIYGFSGPTIEATMIDLAKDKPGLHVFGVSIADGHHSVTITLDNTNPNSPIYKVYDQTGKPWENGRPYQNGTLDGSIINYIKVQATDPTTGQFRGIPTRNGGTGNYKTFISEYKNNN